MLQDKNINGLTSLKVTRNYVVMYLKEVFGMIRRKMFHGNLISKGDTMYFDYSTKYIEDMWKKLGGVPGRIRVKSGIIFITGERS